MGEFTDVCLGFPTVLFGGVLVVVVGFWGLVLVGGADAHGPGHHGAGSHGAGGHGAVHHGPGHATGHGAGSGHGGHGSATGSGHGHGDAHDGHAQHGGSGLLAAAGLDGVPVTVVLSLLTALGWFLSLAGSAALDGAGLHGPVRGAADVALIAAALIGCWLLTWVLVRPLRHLFPYTLPPSREDFVGRIGVIRTGSVTASFGQAEVAAPDGSTAVVQVRHSGDDRDRDRLTAGGTALLYGYDPDGEFFWATPYADPALDGAGPADPAGGPPGTRPLL